MKTKPAIAFQRYVLFGLMVVSAVVFTSCPNPTNNDDDDPIPGTLAVSSITPTDGATDVATTATVEIVFDQAVAQATVTDATITLVDAAGAVVAAARTVSADGKTVTVAPSAALLENGTYTVSVGTEVAGADGATLDAAAAATFSTVSIFKTWYLHWVHGDTEDQVIKMVLSPTSFTITQVEGSTGMNASGTIVSVDSSTRTAMMRWDSSSSGFGMDPGSYMKGVWRELGAGDMLWDSTAPQATRAEAEAAVPSVTNYYYASASAERPQGAYGFTFIGDDKIHLSFLTAMDTTALEDETNWTIGGTGAPPSGRPRAALAGPEDRTVTLVLDEPIALGETITVTIDPAVTSATGAAMYDEWRTHSATFVADVAPIDADFVRENGSDYLSGEGGAIPEPTFLTGEPDDGEDWLVVSAMPANQAYSYMETYGVWHNTDAALSGNWPSAFPALDNPLTASDRAFDPGLYYLQWMFIDDLDGGEVNFVSEPTPYAAADWTMDLEGTWNTEAAAWGGNNGTPATLTFDSSAMEIDHAYNDGNSETAKYRVMGWVPEHNVMIVQCTDASDTTEYAYFLDKYFVMTWRSLQGTENGNTVYIQTYGDYGPDGQFNTSDDVFYVYDSLEEAGAVASNPGDVWSDDLLTHQ
jgi:hypothetical protein